MHTLALYIYQRPTNTYSIFLLIKKTRASTRSAVFTVDANYFFQKSKQSFLIDNIRVGGVQRKENGRLIGFLLKFFVSLKMPLWLYVSKITRPFY